MAEDSVPVMFARLEAKLDVALAQHGAKLDQHAEDLADHETRLRAVEARPVAPTNHEDRLRAIEGRSYITPRAFWTALGVLAGVISALSPYVDRLYGH